MLVAIHQPHYLPWLRYFEKVVRSDAFVVLDNIQFNKNGWQNRNKIRTAGGTTTLTVPVFAKHGQRLDDVRINNASYWRKKHWRSLQQAYAKALYFDQCLGWLEDTYQREWDDLNALNRHMFSRFLETLGLDTPVFYASDLNVQGTATERLINLVKAVGGTAYYSGAHAAQTYLDVEQFAGAGIEVILQRWAAKPYPQLWAPFMPDLAIVDLIANCGPEALTYLQECGQ